MEIFRFALGVLVTVKQLHTIYSHPSFCLLLCLSLPADITSCLCPSVLLEWVSVVVVLVV